MISGPEGHAERGQARRRERGVPVPLLRRRPRSSNPSTTASPSRSRASYGRGVIRCLSPAHVDPGSDDVAALAAAVLEAEIRRTEAAVVPEVVLADAELPGCRRGRDVVARGAAPRWRAHDHDPRAARRAPSDGRRRLQRARARHPGVARRLRRGARRDRGRDRCAVRPRRDPDVVARRTARHASVWSRSRCRCGRWSSRSPARCRTRSRCSWPGSAAGLGPVGAAPRERAAARRHVSDRGAGCASSRCSAARRPIGTMARAVPRGRDRRARRRRQRLAVGVLRCSASWRCRSRSGREHDHGAAAGPARDAVGARRGAPARGGRAADLVVGRVRAAAEDPQLLLLPRRHGRARLRALHRRRSS